MWQIVTIAVMLFLMIALKRLGISSFSGELRPESTVVAGFILVCSFTMGELFRRMRLPALLGYIIFGILFGPSLAHIIFKSPDSALFSRDIVNDLSLISVLAVGVIGIMGGGEMKLSEVKANFKSILAIVGLLTPVTILLIGLLILGISYLLPEKIAFLSNTSLSNKLAAAILFGILTVGMSPSATIAVLQDLRARGALTSLVLGIVVVLDLILVASFLFGVSLSKLLVRPEGFAFGQLLDALPGIGAEMGWAIVVGLTIGVLFILYLRFIDREMLLFTLLIIFGGAYACSILHAERLLAFLIAGFCVQNFSKHGHKMIHALEQISLPVFVLYFSIEAIKLDLKAIPQFLLLTLLISLARTAIFAFCIRLGAQWAGVSESIRNSLWFSFFSKGGVDLVLAAMIPVAAPQWGAQAQVVVMAMVVIHIILGPPLLKLALDRAGETDEARQRAREEAAALDRAFTAEHSIVPANRLFPVPNFPDTTLNQRLTELRSRFVNFHEQHIVQPSEAYNNQLNSLVQKIGAASSEVFEQLQRILSEQGQQQRSIEQLKVEWRRSIQTEIAHIERISPLPVTTSTAQKIISGVRDAVEFGLVLDVECEDELFTHDPDDQFPKRMLKTMRRVRRRLLGPGYRSVQLGKLWRYYVELSMASYLASAALATARQNVLFWYSLGLHMRNIDRVFDKLIEVAKRKDNRLVQATLKDEATASQNRLRQIRDSLALGAKLRLEKYTWGLQEVFHKFIHSVRRCGTWELPSFRYHPSNRFDKARRAEEHLKAMLSREQKIVTGYRGWLLLDQQMALFNSEFIAYQNRVLTMLEEHLEGACRSRFDLLASTLNRPPQNHLATDSQSDNLSHWQDYVEETVRPALTATSQSIEEALALFREGATRELFDLLEGIVHRFSESLVMTLQDPDTEPSETANVETISLPVRQWFETRLVRDIAMRLVEFSERTESLLQRSLADLHRIQSIVEFNLLALQQDTDDSPTVEEQMAGAMRRAAKHAEQAAETIRRETRELGIWIHTETAQILARANQPFEQHRLQEVQREFTLKQSEAWQPQGVATATLSLYQKLAPLMKDLLEDLRERITDSQTALSREEFLSRARLGRHNLQTLPKAYRRLFLPLPLDIADFYVQRPTLEAHLQMALRQWLDGYPTSILIHGERGAGKRTLAQHLLHQNQSILQNVLNRLEECTLNLEEETATEEDICRQIAALTGEEAVSSFDALTALVRAGEMRRIYIVENGEKLYERSREGIQLCRAFMRMVSATSDRVLWVVLLGSPAVAILRNTLDLYGYFTHRLEVDPMDLADLEQLIQKRHRVSGFDLEFEQSDRMVLRRLTRKEDDSPSRRFFQRLYSISHGNPLLALVYWLQSIYPVAGNEGLLRAVVPPEKPLALTSDLALEKRLLLAYLLQHNSLTRTQLGRLLRWEREQVESEIDHLVRLQLVEKITATADSYRIRPFFEPLISNELRGLHIC